jgi:hypothetical protein
LARLGLQALDQARALDGIRAPARDEELGL